MQYEVSTLKKGLQLLDLLRANGPMSMSRLIQTSQLNKTTVFRLLATLEMMGYVEKMGKEYAITESVGQVGPKLDTVENWNMVPPLHELSKELGETVYVAILQGTEVINTQVVDGRYTNRSHTQVGDRFLAHQSALGKVILAFLEENRLRSILANLELQARTDRTFLKEGAVVAALAISGPATRLSKKQDPRFSHVLQRYSEKITSFIQ